MMTVTTQDGSVYCLQTTDDTVHSRVLTIARIAGTDIAATTNQPMQQHRWYRVNLLDPQPPQIGTRLAIILEPDAEDSDPVVRRTGMVTSVVGLPEPCPNPETPALPPSTAPTASSRPIGLLPEDSSSIPITPTAYTIPAPPLKQRPRHGGLWRLLRLGR